MLRLILMRHAKSTWDDPHCSDFSRGLNERGRTAAPLMAQHMVEELGVEPDRVLCSTARRTRETLAACLPFWSKEQSLRMLDDIYHSSEMNYIDLIRSHGGGVPTLMVLGHNPAIQITALKLIEQGSSTMIRAIETKYPTAAVTVLEFREDAWQNVHPAKGYLSSFTRPRDLGSPEHERLLALA
ncbi:MAG: phosphohistidine phosphatase [Hyphomicrobiales bacterium]|nr:MAG: phosphohistidine phosphatase [Hyphomicrobiales bacterium]